jgi:hypothetical protein
MKLRHFGVVPASYQLTSASYQLTETAVRAVRAGLSVACSTVRACRRGRRGRRPTVTDLPIDPGFAADGVDELLCGFITRGRGKLHLTPSLTVVVSAEDTGHSWTVRVSDAAPVTTAGAVDAPHVRLTGTAAQLYLGLWNRGDEVTEYGDAGFLPVWRTAARVRWG